MIEMENSTSQESKESLKVEDALEKLGGFSKFQLLTTLSIVFIELPSAMVALSPVLTGSTNVPFYCQTDDGDLTLIPKQQLCSNNCTGRITSLLPYSSIVQEWNLICDKAWITDTFTSIQMLGNTLGAFVMAYVADRFGRKNAFYIVGCILGISGIPSALSVDPYFYGVTRFVQGFGAGGCFVAHFNYLMEFLTPSWRTICGCVSFWAIGEMLLGLFGYLFPTWRTLAWTTSSPAFAILLVYCFLPESPRWLLCQERTEEAHTVFDQIARWNSKPPLSSAEIQLLQTTVQKEQDQESSAKQHRWKIFRNWIYLKQLLIFVFAWFSNAVIYFGLSYNMKNVHGNPYMNVFFLGLVDFPAELSGIYFSNRFGRRGTFITNLLISCVFLLILVFVEFFWSQEIPYLVLILCLCGRFFNEASWAVMACFTGESFPTVNRTVAMSVCAIASALGGVVAPQFASPNIPKSVPYFVFCGLSFLSSIVSLSLIETRGKPLQDL